MEYVIKPIGYIKTKYRERKETPSQGSRTKSSLGYIKMERNL